MAGKNKKISRRDFFKTAGAVGMGSLVTAGGAWAATPKTADTKPPHPMVPTRVFGKTGVKVPILGLGGIFDIVSNQLVLQQALEWGVTYWDTADCYSGGRSELGIGYYLSKHPEARSRIFLVSKSDDRDTAGLTRLLDRSLQRMETDYIDLYFLHGVNHIKELTPEIKAWAEKAKAAKKIRFFGFSAHSNMEENMLAASKLGWIDGIMMSYNFRLMNTDKMKAAVEACRQAGIGLTAMKTQGGSSVRGFIEKEINLALGFLGKGYSDQQAKLKAVWENQNIACICSQMASISVLMSNVAAALDRTKLTSTEWNLIKEHAEQTASGYCVGCSRICLSALADPMPVNDILRFLMYYHAYGDRELARAHFAELPAVVRRRLTSYDYRAAEKVCPRNIPIAALMREAAEVLA